jgi:hypothetical protein
MSGKKGRPEYLASIEQAVEEARAAKRRREDDAYDRIMAEMAEGERQERANRPLARQVRAAAAPFTAWIKESGLQQIAPAAWAKAPIVVLRRFVGPEGREVPLAFTWYWGGMTMDLDLCDRPLESNERWLLEALLEYFRSEQPWQDAKAWVEERTRQRGG